MSLWKIRPPASSSSRPSSPQVSSSSTSNSSQQSHAKPGPKSRKMLQELVSVDGNGAKNISRIKKPSPRSKMVSTRHPSGGGERSLRSRSFEENNARSSRSPSSGRALQPFSQKLGTIKRKPGPRSKTKIIHTKPGPKSKKMAPIGKVEDVITLSDSDDDDPIPMKTLKNVSDSCDNSARLLRSRSRSSGQNEERGSSVNYSSGPPSTVCISQKPGPKSKKKLFLEDTNSGIEDVNDLPIGQGRDNDYSDLFTPVQKMKKEMSSPVVEDPVHSDAEMESDNDSSSSSPVPEGQYEIEDVLDYVHESTGIGEMYLIKWKNWESDFNTWEPPRNLIDCDDVLLKFYYKRKAEVEAQLAAQTFTELPSGKRRRKGPEIWKIPPDPRPLEIRLREYYAKTKSLCPIKLKEKYLTWNKIKVANKGKDLPGRWSESKINKYVVDGTDGKLSDKQAADLRKELYWVEAARLKEGLNSQLKEWEESINEVTQNKPVIKVENDVDFEGPPSNFQFVSNYIPADGITIPSDPPVGCSCDETSCYENRKKCCGQLCGAQFAYTRYRKVNVPLGRPIWECNSKCSCGPDCVNRVVQDGSNSEVKLCIFRTSNGCGWGVKALKSIKKGSFVCLYVGEVILAEEAERRSKEDKGIQPYLFDLDFNDHENPVYTVDASTVGNVSHFINHSCEPNLGVYAVWVDCLDPNLPKLAMFALSDIARGEELSFDYLNRVPSDSDDEDEDNREDDPDFAGATPPSPSKANRNANMRKQKCLCGSKNCRQFLYV